MFRVLPNVNLVGVTPQCFFAMAITSQVFDHYNRDCVITSAKDGKHSDGSLHYTGNAFDVRIKHLDGNDKDITEGDLQQARIIAFDIKHSIGDQYDVVVEANHIHIEFDPR